MHALARSPDLIVTADLIAARDHVALRYTAENRAAFDLFLFNRLYRGLDDQGRYDVDVNRVTIALAGAEVVIAKKLTPLPDLVFFELPNLPCVTALAPGERFEEALRIPLPLVPWTPYEHAPGGIRSARGVRFELGYFVGGALTRSHASLVPTSIGPQLRFKAFAEGAQSLVSVGPFPPLPTLEP